MKKTIPLMVALLMSAVLLAGCDSADAPSGAFGTENGLPSGVSGFSGEERETEPETPPASSSHQGQTEKEEIDKDDETQMEANDQLMIRVGDATLTAVLTDNSSAAALRELLREGPVTIAMRDYGNMEKVGPLGENLPTNDEQITVGPGDLILYQGNSFVIYYGTNTWNLTRLGKIEHVSGEELKAVLGSGDVTVTLELPDTEEKR